MTLIGTKIYRAVIFFPLLLLLSGFGSERSLQENLDEAERALQAANSANIATYAPLELKFAAERMQQARLAVETKDKAALQRISEEVLVTVELATAKARLAKAREQVEEKVRQNEQLNREMAGSHEGRSP